MSKDYMVINTEFFEVIHPRTWTPEPSRRFTKSLHECYANPSARKQAIYREWLEWVDTIDYGEVKNFDVYSYTSQFFNLAGDYYEHGKFIGNIEVTPQHNRIYLP